jgi:hypothetical protein
VGGLEFPESRASIRRRLTSRCKEDKSRQRRYELANKQDEAKTKDEAEDTQLCVVARARRVPMVEELHHRSHECRQEQHQCPELEKSKHKYHSS